MADAQAADIKDLLGGALFKALYKWMLESGPVYLLPTGGLAGSLVGGWRTHSYVWPVDSAEQKAASTFC